MLAARHMTVLFILMVAASGAAVEGGVTLRLQLIDPNGEEIALDEVSPKRGGNAFIRGGFEYTYEGQYQAGMAFMVERFPRENVFHQGAIPWPEALTERSLSRDDVSVSVTLELEGDRSFPYHGTGRLEGLEAGQERTLAIRLDWFEAALPKESAEVTFRLESAATGEALAGWTVRADGKPVTSDDRGLITVEVADISKNTGVALRASDVTRYPERISMLITPEQIQGFLQDGEPIVVRSDPPALLLRAFLVDESGKRRPFTGNAWLNTRRKVGDKISVGRPLRLRHGYGVLYEIEGSPFEAGQEIALAPQDGFEGLRLRQDRLVVPEDGQPRAVDLVFETTGPRSLTIAATDAVTGAAVAEVLAVARGADMSPVHARSDTAGAVVLRDLPWKALQVTLSADGYEDRRWSVSPSFAKGRRELALMPLINVEVRVRTDQRSVPSTAVILQVDQGLKEYGTDQADAGGTLRIEKVPARAGTLVIIDDQARAVATERIDLVDRQDYTLDAHHHPLSIAAKVTGGPAHAVRMMIFDAWSGAPLHKNPITIGDGSGQDAVHWLGHPMLVYAEVGGRGWTRIATIKTVPESGAPVEVAIDLTEEHEWQDDEEVFSELLTQ